MVTDRWNNYLEYFPERAKDIYFTEEYVRLYANDRDTPECFIYKKGGDILLFPYLKRRIELLREEYFDLETPYGYGGPIANTGDPSFISEAFGHFCSLAKENRIIAGFIRLHPLLGNHISVRDKSHVVFDRKTVAIDLDIEERRIWEEQIHSKHRNSIRKAQGAGLIFNADEGLQYLDDFVKIYRLTVDRLKTDRFYYFDEKYFDRIRAMGQNVFLGLVFLKKSIISGALFFKYGIFGHFHLAGSLKSYQRYNPNNFLIYNTALYMKRNGVKRFHLGGGTDSSEQNTLYKFKKRFSKNEHSFYFSKLILDEKRYAVLSDVWESKFPEKKKKYSNLVLKHRY
ncbi:GNAT family N-acetyltransferase [Candidatus Omnitrophota bacterium]